MTSPAENTFDILVVGAGGSGLATAVSAAEGGARVLVLEKQATPGGTTGMAVGSFTAANTSLQEQAGVSDSVDDHVEDAAGFAPPEIEARNNAAMRKAFLTEAAATFEWLKGMGLAFHGPSPEPPNRAPRMHNVVPAARAYVYTLAERLRTLGGEIRCNAPVTRLIVEEGRVAGVVASCDGAEKTLRAVRGVVLAAGDYSGAPDLIARFKGEAYGRVEGINTNAHGDGHRLAESVGAPLVNMDVTYGPELRFIPSDKKSVLDRLPAGGVVRNLAGSLMPFAPKFMVNALIKQQLVSWQHPEDALFDDGAILVNQAGQRFCDETRTPDRELAIAEQAGGHAYLLLDAKLAERYRAWPHYISTAPEIAYAYVKDYLRLRPDVACAGSSVGDLATTRNIDGSALEATVADYNACLEEGSSDPFGREVGRVPLAGDRWVLLGPAKAYFTITEGSPECTPDGQVLGDDGTPIDGLYAVGQNGLNGQILFGHGLHIAWAMTSGRLVGQRLAKGR